jgi:hypothetical protein
MATVFRKWRPTNFRNTLLVLAPLLVLLISPAVAPAEVIYEDDFDGLISPLWFSDWGQWISQGYDGTNDPGDVGCNQDEGYCGPDDPPTLAAGNMPVPRPFDTPGSLTSGAVGWTTLRMDPPGVGSNVDCDPMVEGSCLPCDPATQECYERADGKVTMTGIDISNVTTDWPIDPISGNSTGGVAMGLVARFTGLGGASGVETAISGTYLTAYDNQPQIFFDERKWGIHSNRVKQVYLPHALESPLHMEMTVEGDNVSFTVGDEDEQYTTTMVNGEHVHNIPGIPTLHQRPISDPGRWGFWSHAAVNGNDWTTWDDFRFTTVDHVDAAPGVPGDYNDDGTVDAADYTVFQDSAGVVVDFPGRDPSLLGTPVGAGDYAYWSARFGNTASGVGAAAAVPEPGTVALLMIGFVVLAGKRGVQRR